VGATRCDGQGSMARVRRRGFDGDGAPLARKEQGNLNPPRSAIVRVMVGGAGVGLAGNVGPRWRACLELTLAKASSFAHQRAEVMTDCPDHRPQPQAANHRCGPREYPSCGDAGVHHTGRIDGSHDVGHLGHVPGDPVVPTAARGGTEVLVASEFASPALQSV